MTTLPHLTPKQARDLLVGHLGLRQRRRWEGASSGLEVLRSLRCIQLDPLERRSFRSIGSRRRRRRGGGARRR